MTAQKFLDAGYRVRGTVRDVAKHEWMLSHFGPKFELFQVPDLGASGALDEAVKGVDGIAHVASPVTESYQPDPQVVIPNGIRCAISLLESAAKEPSVKSVVYTSSQAACILFKPGERYHITADSWNEESKKAWTEPIEPSWRRSILNYMAAKTEAEQHSFKWVKEHQPHFTFNTVVPNVNFGTVTRPDKLGCASSSGLLALFWQGSTLPVDIIPPEYFVDVEDTALLHVAVLTQPDVKNERILAMATPFSYNEILAIFKKLAPERTFLDQVDEIPDQGTIDNARAEELLKRVKNGQGWSTLEEAITKWCTLKLNAEKEGVVWPLSSAEAMAGAFEQMPKEYRTF